MPELDYLQIGFYLVVGVFLILLLFNLISFFKLWLEAKLSEVPVTIEQLIAMKLRGVPPAEVVHAGIRLHKAGIKTNYNELEAHCLAGGNLQQVTEAAVVAKNLGMEISFGRIRVLDLGLMGTGADIPDMVRKYGNSPDDMITRALEEYPVSS